MQCDQKESVSGAVEGGQSRSKTRPEIDWPNFVHENFRFVSRNCEILVEVAYSRHARAFAGAQICHPLRFFAAQTFCFWAFERGRISLEERQAFIFFYFLCKYLYFNNYSGMLF